MVGTFLSFCRDVLSEVSKISWASRRNVLSSAILVLLIVCASSIFFFAIDLLFSYIVKLLLGIVYEL